MTSLVFNSIGGSRKFLEQIMYEKRVAVGYMNERSSDQLKV